MSKIQPQEIKDLQFFTEQFGSPADFTVFLQAIIDTQESLLSGMIGAATFGSVNQVIADRVISASKSLVAVELFRRRINRLSGNVTADTIAIIRALQTSQQAYQTSADEIITRLVASPDASNSIGFSSGVVVSSHFGDGA